jgi:hypothetical protein
MPTYSYYTSKNTRYVVSAALYFQSILMKRRNAAEQCRKTLIRSPGSDPCCATTQEFPILDWKNELTNGFQLTVPQTYSLIFVSQGIYSHPEIKSILCYKRFGSKSKLMWAVAVLQGRPLPGG